MLLTIDVGNTNMVFGLYEGDKLRGSFRISTNAERTSDELGMQISQYYHFHGIDRAETRAVIIASVVPPVMYTLINAIRKYLRVQPLVAGKDVDIGIENKYANPREVGADRLVNAVSAVRKYGKPLIIVDIGTATTFDAIDAAGAYQGGAIFPGIKVAMEALFLKASKLPACGHRAARARHRQDHRAVHAVGRGARLCGRADRHHHGHPARAGRPGARRGDGRHGPHDGRLLRPDRRGSTPNLTLEGLRLIYENNRQAFAGRHLDGEECMLETAEGWEQGQVSRTGKERQAMKKIYLAGFDVFAPDARQRGAQMKMLCAGRGCIGLYPLDNEAACAADIFAGNCGLIDQADAVIANLNPFRGQEPDSGTCFEVGYAFAKWQAGVRLCGGTRAPCAKSWASGMRTAFRSRTSACRST